VDELSDEQIYREIGRVIENFDILECAECAQAILDWLRDNGIAGKVLRLRTQYRDEDFIVSSRLEARGVLEAITANGTHYGVEVRGRVFNNLSTDGMAKADWLDDCSCPSGQFILDELEDLGGILDGNSQY
jgi:hypothetical protein